MEQQGIRISIIDAFADLPDPRVDRRKLHDLTEIIVIAICATIAGCEGWEDIQDFGLGREKWLRRFLKLENGIPHHDTFRRVFERIDPDKFLECFVNWQNGLRAAIAGEVISLDGKSLRGAFKRSSTGTPVHLVNAYASERGIALAQQEVDSKSNEITAIPKLLDMLLLEGCIITTDAMGCQKNIASKVIDRGADYLLAVKKNHEHLYEDISEFFKNELNSGSSDFEIDSHEEADKGHGRHEIRRCYSTSDIAWMGQEEDWKNIKSIVMVETETTIKDNVRHDTRFYISSLDSDAEKLGHTARSHWGVENSLHWVLDVTFGEDASRVAHRTAATNLALLRKIALNILKSDTTRKKSIRRKRKISVWDDSYMLQLLAGNDNSLKNLNI